MDATSDILLAMDQKLTALGPQGDADLLERVRGRLREMGIPPSGAAVSAQ